jgi:site-specific recombinase XerD
LGILLGALAGLRCHEIAKVRGEDVDPAARTLRVTGKGSKTATLPLHPLLVEAAKTMPTQGYWFPGGRSGNVNPAKPVLANTVGNTIKAVMIRAGVPASAHQLWHWYGSTLVGDGADLRTAQTLLRHTSLNTTAAYVAVHDEKRIEAVNRLDPFGDPT